MQSIKPKYILVLGDSNGDVETKSLNIISKLPDQVEIDEIMYRLYVLDKIRKGRESIKWGDVISIDDLTKEMESWH